MSDEFRRRIERRDKRNVSGTEWAEKGRERKGGDDRANILVKLVECTVNGSLSLRELVKLSLLLPTRIPTFPRGKRGYTLAKIYFLPRDSKSVYR